jgi:fructose-bisphosphate aldolase class II
MNAKEVMRRAEQYQTIVPAFNIPYLPMVEPVTRAIIDEDSVAMLQVARLEWEKFHSQSPEAVAAEYFKFANPKHTLLHLDHVPVIDEDERRVDYMPIFERAIKAGYQSVMIDGSRLVLDENIALTHAVADLAHRHGIVLEAELGAVAGHGRDGIGLSYDELFESKKGFTKTDEADRFARESGCDWLSVAVGSVHGAIAENLKRQKKPAARLDIEHIKELKAVTGAMPLVLHGGSGILQEYILQAVEAGIAKINVGTEIRQPYEFILEETGSIPKAQDAVYDRTRWVLSEFLHVAGNATLLSGEES